MKEKLTMKDIEKAIKLIEKDKWKCPKCNMGRDFMVLGICDMNHLPLFCECEADRLCKTPYVKKLLEKLKMFVNLKQ